MGTTFNAAAFRASPFMMALTAIDAVPDTEKQIIDRQVGMDQRNSLWKMEGQIRALFFHARAACFDRHNSVRDGRDSTEFCQRNAEIVQRMTGLLNEWAAIPSRGKTHAATRLQFLRELRGHTSGMGTFDQWSPSYQGWIAKIEAERAAFASVTPAKKRGR